MVRRNRSSAGAAEKPAVAAELLAAIRNSGWRASEMENGKRNDY